METRPLEDFKEIEEEYTSEVPEDVSILYSWANLQGEKYRNLSAGRRDERAQMRHRVAEQLQRMESQAQADSQAAASQAAVEAAAAHAHADALVAKHAGQGSGFLSPGGPTQADPNGSRAGADDRKANGVDSRHSPTRTASHQARKAAAERDMATRRAQAAALADSQARREEREVPAGRYAEADLRGGLTGSTGSPSNPPGRTGGLYPSRSPKEDEMWVDEEARGRAAVQAHLDIERTAWGIALDNQASGIAPERAAVVTAQVTMEGSMQVTVPIARKLASPTTISEVGERSPGATIPHAKCEFKNDSKAEVVERILPADNAAGNVRQQDATTELAIEFSSLFEVTEHAISELFEAEPVSESEIARADRPNDIDLRHSPEMGVGTRNKEGERRARRPPVWGADVPGPAWLYPRQHASGIRSLAIQAAGDVPESLDHSKERIAARWFALRSVFARHDVDRSSERVAGKDKEKQAPIVAVFSIAGGAGKTSLVATLGRALSFLGERVLLSDTTSHGLLPFYFGASQLVSGVVRTFTPPAGSTDAPIHLVTYDVVRESDEAEGQAGIVDNLLENSQRANRVLLDLSVNSSRMVGRLGQFKPTILIPLLPDMNSVISIDGVEKLFGSMLDADGRPLQPFYLLNQFDASLPLHLDIREVLKQQLGERLLPFVIRRSAAVGEALAEGMTIVDYDAGSPVVEDYLRAANWLRSVSAPVAVGFRNQRWSEQ